MARYIDADKVKDLFCENCSTKNRYHRTVEECRNNKDVYGNECFKMRYINEAPTEDVVPVVRCSQCRKRYTTECALWFSQLDDKQYFCGAIHNDDFYCSYGERKD